MKSKRKNILKVSAVIIFAVVCCVLGWFIAGKVVCKHEFVYASITQSATCLKDGSADIFCADCNKFLREETVPAKGHTWSEYEVFEAPSVSKNGIETRTCTRCGEKEFREFECRHEETISYVLKSPTCSEFGRESVICAFCNTVVEIKDIDKLPHEETKTVVSKAATCQETGIEDVVCKECGEVVEQHEIPLAEHSFGKWTYTKYATPFEDGERSHTCTICDKAISESYQISLGQNYIYIEGTGVVGNLTITSLSQGAVDGHDMVYDRNYFGCDGAWVLGHKTGTLSRLNETKVGSTIYLSINGNVSTYEVVISEFAMQNADWTNIVGQTTGTSIFDYSGEDTLHMYTCYGGTNGRWMVIAEKV